MKLPKLKLRGQLVIATGIMVLLPLLLIGYLVDLTVKKTIISNAVDHNQHLGMLIRSKLTHFLDQEQNRLNVVAKAPGFSQEKDRELLLNNLFQLSGSWASLYYIDYVTGEIKTAVPSKPTPNPLSNNEIQFQNAIKSRNTYISDMHFDNISSQKVITLFSALG